MHAAIAVAGAFGVVGGLLTADQSELSLGVMMVLFAAYGWLGGERGGRAVPRWGRVASRAATSAWERGGRLVRRGGPRSPCGSGR